MFNKFLIDRWSVYNRKKWFTEETEFVEKLLSGKNYASKTEKSKIAVKNLAEIIGLCIKMLKSTLLKIPYLKRMFLTPLQLKNQHQHQVNNNREKSVTDQNPIKFRVSLPKESRQTVGKNVLHETKVDKFFPAKI